MANLIPHLAYEYSEQYAADKAQADVAFQAYFAGATEERDRLTAWHTANEIPPHESPNSKYSRPVLVVSHEKDGDGWRNVLRVTRYNFNGCHFKGANVFYWREIIMGKF